MVHITTWTAPKTWAAGTLTSSELNTHVRDNLTHLKEQLTGSASVLSSNVTHSSTSWGDLTGLSFACVSGHNYSFDFFLTYEHSSTSGGPAVGYGAGSGECLLFIVYTGETASDSSTVTQVAAEDSGAGVATVDTANAKRTIRGWGIFQATADGTFKLRMKANTTGTTTYHKGGSLRAISD